MAMNIVSEHVHPGSKWSGMQGGLSGHTVFYMLAISVHQVLRSKKQSACKPQGKPVYSFNILLFGMPSSPSPNDLAEVCLI